MHISTSQRFGELPKEDQERLKDHVEDSAHIITGTVDGNGATELASEKAKFDAKILKLGRTASGGIEYQFAIFVDEPEPEVAKPEVVVLPPTAEQEAVQYFKDEGFSQTDAEAQVKRFGSARVLAMRDARLNDELAKVLTKE